MNPTDFGLVLTTLEDAHVIRNLWPLYLQDISAYDGQVPNCHGVITEHDTVQSWEQSAGPGDWWSRPATLFPYLILANGRPAGFQLIASGPYVPTAGVDFMVYEFFLAHAYRGTGLAAWAAQQGISKHLGNWEVVTYPHARLPIAFWRKTLPHCASGEVRISEVDHAHGRKLSFRFDNRSE